MSYRQPTIGAGRVAALFDVGGVLRPRMVTPADMRDVPAGRPAPSAAR